MQTTRIISAKRAKKLRKRGEAVKWSPEHHAFVWEMKVKHTNIGFGFTIKKPIG